MSLNQFIGAPHYTARYYADRRWKMGHKSAAGLIWKRYFTLGQRVSAEEFRLLWDEYRKSKWWQARRTLVFQRCAGTCERCAKAPAEEVHHLHYGNRFNEPLADLLGVCAPCHRFLSRKGADPGISTLHASVESIERKMDSLLIMHTEAGARTP